MPLSCSVVGVRPKAKRSVENAPVQISRKRITSTAPQHVAKPVPVRTPLSTIHPNVSVSLKPSTKPKPVTKTPVVVEQPTTLKRPRSALSNRSSIEPPSKRASLLRPTAALSSSEKFKSFAALVDEFHMKTPPRYHTRSRTSLVPEIPDDLRLSLSKTVPVEFSLRTKERSRDSMSMTSEDMEVAEILEWQKLTGKPTKAHLDEEGHFEFATEARALSRSSRNSDVFEGAEFPPFKALPLDRKILESCGDIGVPKIAKLPPTVPMDVDLHTAARATVPRIGDSAADGDEEEDAAFSAFKARPVPWTHYRPTTPTPPTAAPLTIPQPFAFLSETRANRAVPKSDTPSQIPLPRKRLPVAKRVERA
eukprot:gnl/Spiro4/6640_TR3429_c0_g1_i1.p1 gnl/Spiro4/6640_TR3429_c0_g1~~gnl/Spiro4/6640_TR3429_c0_g1_i1.p1  ORF type:complete len:377 (-),score=56.11 gnl/Spiro4/6640_TR3429_c0_g1_i1:66-1157(-)